MTAEPRLQFDPDGDLLRLTDAARQAGVTVAQLEYYLMVGVVQPAAVSTGDQRLFDRHAVKRIQLVRMMNATGYPLREIREIFVAPRWRRADRVPHPPV